MNFVEHDNGSNSLVEIVRQDGHLNLLKQGSFFRQEFRLTGV